MSPVTVTDRYSISGPVPFLNVAVHQDNLLFLDPTAIRNSPDPLAQRAHRNLTGFFSEVLRCRLSPSPADQAKGLDLLKHLHEPNQTRLGMSARGAAGHGLGVGLGAQLWHELDINPACRAAALTRVEDLRLFVDGVGNDLVSDLTTRIVFDVLVDFTAQMMVRFPSLAVGATTQNVPLWDPTSSSWRPTEVPLPYVAPHQLLLVPRGWVYWRTLLDPYAFYNRFGTQTVQQERTTRDQQGKLWRPRKAALKTEFGDVRRLNNQQASKYMADGIDLVAAYRDQVDEEYEPLTDEQLQQRLLAA